MGEKDGCPKIKEWIGGLTGSGCGDRASRLMCKDKIYWGPG